MSYKCKVCNRAQPRGTPVKLHVEYREVPRQGVRHVPKALAGIDPYAEDNRDTRLEISREIQVCSACKRMLDVGRTIAQVMQEVSDRPEGPPEVEQDLQTPDDLFAPVMVGTRRK